MVCEVAVVVGKMVEVVVVVVVVLVVVDVVVLSKRLISGTVNLPCRMSSTKRGNLGKTRDLLSPFHMNSSSAKIKPIREPRRIFSSKAWGLKAIWGLDFSKQVIKPLKNWEVTPLLLKMSWR